MTPTIYWRGAAGYEKARLDAVWNELKPDRFPAGILMAESDQDVITAVKLARERGLKVKARSGGHSWTASGVRDDSLLVNLAALDEVTVDPARLTATVGPGARSRALDIALRPYGLFFPTGHAISVAIGGFLLQGGWGWNSKALGPACLSVTGIDLVTADGELVHADESANTELLWAARGAGPGFFGLVTRFYLRLHPRPRSMMTTEIIYPLDATDDVLTWAATVGQQLPRSIELTAFAITPRVDNQVVDGPVRLITRATGMTDSPDETAAALRWLEECPVFDQAIEARLRVPANMDSLFGLGSSSEAPGYRYAVDNMWSSARAEDLVPALHEMFMTVPTVASHAALGTWPMREIPDAALSITGELFIQAFTGWTNPADDDRYQYWGRDHLRRLDKFANGIQLADENLARRPEAKFLSDAALDRLERLRDEWDPDGLFLSYWLGDR